MNTIRLFSSTLSVLDLTTWNKMRLETDRESAVAAGWARDENEMLGLSISRDTNDRWGTGGKGTATSENKGEQRVKLELGKSDRGLADSGG